MEEIQPTTWFVLCAKETKEEKNQFQTTNLRWLMTKFYSEYTPSMTEMVIERVLNSNIPPCFAIFIPAINLFPNRLLNKYLYQLWFSSAINLVFECVVIVGKVFHIAHDTFVMVFLSQLDRIQSLIARIAMLLNCITGMHTHTYAHTHSLTSMPDLEIVW